MSGGNRPRRPLLTRGGPAWLLALVILAATACTSAPPSAPAAPSDRPASGAPAGAAPAATAVAAQPAIPLRVAYAAPGAGLAPVWVAQERGVFREQGLDVELVLLSGTRTDQAVLAGDTPIGFGANVIPTRLGGADMVAIAGVVTRLSYTLFARQGITSPQELRGKTMITTLPGASNTSASLIVLRHFGLEPNRDVSLQPAQATPEQLTLMVQGLGDAAVFSPPTNLKAAEAGLANLGNLSDLRIPFMQTAIGIMRAYGRDNPDVVRRFLRAYVSATVIARNDAPGTRALIGQYSQTDDPLVLDDAYAYFRDIWGRPDFRVPPEAVESILRVLDVPGAATAQAADFIDNRFIDELDESGYLRQAGALD